MPCPICLDSNFIAAPRHVAAWADLTASEQFNVLARVGEALNAGLASFTASSEHGHFHLRRTNASTPRLTKGGTDPLLPLVTRDIDTADQVDLAVAFAMTSGVALIEPWFRDLLRRGGRLRIVVGDYMDVTEPTALRRLSDLEGADIHVHQTGRGSFHPKAWLFRAADRSGAAIVGSSNLSQTALTTGVEWNLHSEDAADAVEAAFEELLAHPLTQPLTEDWITQYAARRREAPLPVITQQILAAEPSAPVPEPHEIQRAALDALADTRAHGLRRGLVVLATGLGKTWLAAFDSQPFARVLFVAHREEILTQAMSSFRRIRPEARFGRYDGSEKTDDAELIFASIQTLGATQHLRRFAPDAFDYIVVDEFHHAAAASYRNLLDHFTPRFLLGLTATPDRSDGADLLALCDENLVYQCDLFEGIDANLLSPFRYVGVPDAVDYAQIPWRSSRFDPTELEAALATEARAQNALEQLRKHGNGPAIGFCCSMRHADFMAGFFAARGLRAVAVHSGAGSAPRATSLQDLREGRLDILFAVDMFNEGVDLPEVSTVMMLRPTESVIIWLQQLGRGLRRVEGKILRVIDYIGNHRIFLTKVRALLSAGPGDRSLAMKVDEVAAGQFSLPEGCSVTYELEAIRILRDLLRPKSGMEDLEAQYRDFRMREGVRPTAYEIARMGFDPARTGHGTWFDFVRDMGDPVEPDVLTTHAGLLRQIERERTLEVEDLTAVLAAASGAKITGTGARVWAVSPLFRPDGDGVILGRKDATGALRAMVQELVDWRLSTLAQKRPEIDDQPATAPTPPVLWREYLREEIAQLFGATFNPGNWNAGIVRLDKDLILLTTLNKSSMAAGNHYDDGFLSPDRLRWQSQTQTRQDSLIGRILSGHEPGTRVHIFIRNGKLRNGKAAPFLYCGQPVFEDWSGERPITVTWSLPQPVPEHLRKSLAVLEG